MFAIEVETVFSAAHALRLLGGAGGGAEPLHGHDFRVTARVTARRLDTLGTVLDFHQLEAALLAIVAPWRNRNLNEIPPFDGEVNPSAERIAEHIGQRLAASLERLEGAEAGEGFAARGVRLAEVRITEAPGCLAIWRTEPG